MNVPIQDQAVVLEYRRQQAVTISIVPCQITVEVKGTGRGGRFSGTVLDDVEVRQREMLRGHSLLSQL
jgi:hypothetical protein